MRSPKFLQADGGWKRIVWLPSEVKEKVKDWIPPDLVDKIPTEKEVTNIEELKAFLKEKGHPIVETWKEEEKEEEAVKEAEEEAVPTIMAPTATVTVPAFGGGVGYKIILKNARIYADKVIIKMVKSKKEGRK